MLGLATDLLEKAKRGENRRGREVQQLDLSYRGSSLSRPGPALGALAAGDRMPDAALTGAAGQARRLFDLLAVPGWSLLSGGDGSALAVAPRRGLSLWSVGPSGAIRDTRARLALADGSRLLIRPDGYIGAIFSAADSGELDDYLAAVLPADRVDQKSTSS
jgi:hypothetical protein